MPEGDDSGVSAGSEGGCSSTGSPSPMGETEETSEEAVHYTKLEKEDSGLSCAESNPLPVTSTLKDSEETSSKGDGGVKKVKPTLSSIARLFRYSTKLDWLLMGLGAVAAIMHGLILPVALLFVHLITAGFQSYEVATFIARLNFSLPLDFLLSIGNTDFKNSEDSVLRFRQAVNYNPDPNKVHIGVDILSITGGIINCSKMYSLEIPYPYSVSFPFTIGDIVRAFRGSDKICYDTDAFLSLMDTFMVGLVAMTLVSMLLGSLHVLFFHTAAERMVKKIRLSYFHAALSQDRAWYDGQPPGEVSARLSNNIEKIDSGLGANISIFIQWVATFFAGLVVAFSRSWELTLILLFFMPLIIVPSAVFNRLIATFVSEEQNHYAAAGSVAEEVLSAIRTVVAFGGEHREVERYKTHLSSAKKIGVKRGLIGGISQFTIYFAMFTSYGVSLLYGAYLVDQENSTGGSVLAVLFSMVIGAYYLGQSTINIGNLMSAATAADPIFKTIDNKSSINLNSEEGVIPSKGFTATIEFKNVSFFYPSRPGIKVLNNFSMSVAAGESVAVVGPSGGGKSTSVSLIQRFYDVTQGQVLIGGVDVRSLNVRWLRSQIGVVSQEPVLFNTSIKENIQMGHTDASMSAVVKAAKAANAHNFITALPNGYHTVVGEQGAMLSGGQKQRIAIARALVRDPKILLLDEVTSALDTENEVSLQEALMKAAGERTVIIVTHRLPLVKSADRVVSVEGGCVEWTGTPSQLYTKKKMKYQSKFVHGGVTESQQLLAHPAHGQTLSLRRQNFSLKRQKQSQCTKRQYTTATLIYKALSFNKDEWWIVVIGVIAAAISGLAFPALAVLFGEGFVVLTISYTQQLKYALPWALSFIALGIVVGIAFFVKILCFSVSGESLTHRIRHLTFKAMLRQEIGWFDKECNDTGFLTNMLSDDARNIQGAAGANHGAVVEGIVAVLFAHFVGFIFNWPLTLVLLFVVPLYVFSGWLQVKVLVGFVALRRRSLQEANDIAVECIENIETVAALGLEPKFYKDFTKKLKKPSRCSLALAPLYGVSQGVLLLGYIIAFRFGAYQVTVDENNIIRSNVLDVFRVFAALAFASVSIGVSGSLAPDYAAAKLSAGKILELLERKPDPDGYSEDGLLLDKVKGEIKLKNINFNYPVRPNVKVLCDLSITVPAGKTLALVGESGSGKSTIFTLIERFYSPISGAISLDGVDYKDMNIRWLRSKIGIVSQEPVLFDMSIGDNIRYGTGNRNVTDKEIIQVAKAANIHEFISSLPQGYSTNVGMKGTQLSGGQKQRIAIARAILQDPSVLLLDEATSALDDASEKVVQAALERVQEGRTSIVITHRLATIQNADVIGVLRNGNVVEVGTHKELMEKQEHYYHMVTLQDLQ